jgi:hypothetical protein
LTIFGHSKELPNCIKELKPKKGLKQLGEKMTNIRLNKAHLKNNNNKILLKIIQTNKSKTRNKFKLEDGSWSFNPLNKKLKHIHYDCTSK